MPQQEENKIISTILNAIDRSHQAREEVSSKLFMDLKDMIMKIDTKLDRIEERTRQLEISNAMATGKSSIAGILWGMGSAIATSILVIILGKKL